MATAHKSRLEIIKEEPLDPGLRICDPHHHLVAHPDLHYFIKDFLEDTSGGHKIVQTVCVECKSMYRPHGSLEISPVGETEFLVAQNGTVKNGAPDVGAGIVGFADLMLGTAVIPVLEAHLTAGKNRFRGIRNMATWDASPDIPSMTDNPKLMRESKFREGFSCLRRYGLSYDAWIYHTQLMDVVDLAKAFPEVLIVLNHIGTPIGVGPYGSHRKEVFREWQRAMATVATCSNVSVKLGGLGMAQCGFGWREQSAPPSSGVLAEAMAPYFLWCIDKFGVDRCMFESNFPMDKPSYSYVAVWNAFKRLTKDFTAQERVMLFYGTAAKVYRLST